MEYMEMDAQLHLFLTSVIDEVRDLPHAPTALPPEKEPPVRNE
jgi:hypothetical protein